jgi:hypothetical protein
MVPSGKNRKHGILESHSAEINTKLDATKEKTHERTERQIVSLVSIMEAARKTDRDEIKQEIRACQEHIE